MLRVVIADDSHPVRDCLDLLISDVSGVEVVGLAVDATEALELVQRLRPDVVILDISMPGGSGIDVLRTLKAGEAAPVAIMLTAFPFPQYRERSLEAGADYFFDKATDYDRVPEVLRELRASVAVDEVPKCAPQQVESDIAE